MSLLVLAPDTQNMGAMKPRTLRTLHVLLVESDRDRETAVRRGLLEITEFSCDVVTCETGADALEIYSGDTPDVVLLGTRLVDVNGLEVLAELADSALSPAVPVILLTPDAGDEAGTDALRLGAQDYLGPDDVSAALLVRSIRYAIERHALIRELHRSQRAIPAAPGPALVSAPESGPMPRQAPPVLIVEEGRERAPADAGAGLELVRVGCATGETADPRMSARALARTGVASPIRRCVDLADARDYLTRRGAYVDPWRSPRPGAIVLDLDTPGSNGSAFLSTLKSDESLRKIPVIVLARSNDPRDITAWYRAGANSYVQRPATLAGFLDAIEQLAGYWLEIAVLPRADVAAAGRDDAVA